jgi:hypothetical protein
MRPQILAGTRLTDLDPYPEILLLGVADSSSDGTSLGQNNGDSQQESDRGDIDHVARDNAVVENLGVNPAHVVEGRLLLLVAAGRQRRARPRVDLCEPPTSPREHARLL